MLKNRIRHTIIFVLLLIAAIPAWAGITYPVSLTAQLLPPYSNCLSDYANGSGMNRLVVNALLRDLNHPSYDITVRLTVRQGSRVVLETNSGATQPYRLTPGMFTPIDPNQLLDPRNATVGGHYADNGFCLPEGGYEIILQAFDARNRNVPLSEPQRIFTYLSKSQPPIPTFPQDGSCVSESSPTITFSWMDAIATSPATDKKFLLEVFEMPEGFGEDGNFNSDKNAMLLSGAKKVCAEPLEGFITSHVVPVTAGSFVKGHTYVWRVRAFCPSRESVTNKDGTTYGTSDYYENGGYSAISTFTFKHCANLSAFEMLTDEPKVDESVAPELLRIDLVTGPSAVWRNEPDKFPDGYVVEYNTSSETAEWSRIEVSPTESSVALPGIAQGVKYVVRVKGIKHDDKGETVYTAYSNKLPLQLPEKEEVPCGKSVPALTSTTPIGSLSVGQTITANGHDVLITTVEQNGDRFSGTGVSTISFLGVLGKAVGIKMRFENIRVNENLELMEGTIVSISDPENSISLNANGALNETYAGAGFEQQTTSFGAESNTSTTLSGGQLSWTDSKGNTYNEKVTDNAAIETQCTPQENSIDDNKGKVVFSPDKDAPLPFDDDKTPFSSNAINKYYTTYGTSFRYNVPWFALAENATGQVIATFEGGDNSVGPDEVVFICRSGKQTVTLPAELIGDNTFRVQIFAGEVDKHLDIYAMAKANGADVCANLTLGRAKIATLRNETKTLHIVPVLGATVDEKAIQEKLDETYLPFGKKFEVVKEDNFGTENDPDFEFLKDGLAVEGSGFMKTETEEMATLKYLYNTKVGFMQNNTNSTQADHAYIFILPKAETGGVMGDMPRCKPVGYIFLDGNTDIPSTVAHEIGHGVFALEHTFEFGGASQGETCKQSSRSNLMDYCSPQGNYLTVWQWNLLDNHKDYVIPFLEGDDDAMFSDKMVFYDPDFRLFKCKLTRTIYINNDVPDIQGVIGGLSLKDNQDYVYDLDKKRYKNTEQQDIFLDVDYNITLSDNDIVTLLYRNKEDACSSKLYVAKYSYTKTHINEIKSGAAFVNTNPDVKFYNYARCSKFEDTKNIFTIGGKYEKYKEELLEIHYKLASKAKVPIYEDENVISSLLGKIEDNYSDLLADTLIDKLRTYEQMNNKKFKVLICEVNHAAKKQKDWNRLAKVVFERANLGPNDILITIPYIHVQYSGGGAIFYQAGYYYGSRVDVNVSKLKTYDYSDLIGINKFIYDFFTHTSKKWQFVDGIYLATNTITFSVVSSEDGEEKSGYSFNRCLRLWREKKYDELKSLIDKLNEHYKKIEEDLSGKMSNPAIYPTEAHINPINQSQILESHKRKNKERINEKILEMYTYQLNVRFEDAFELYVPSTDKLSFKEEFLLAENNTLPTDDDELYRMYTTANKYANNAKINRIEEKTSKNKSFQRTNAYAYVYLNAFNDMRKVIGYKEADRLEIGNKDHVFDFDQYYWTPIDKVVYGVVDCASCVLGVFGFDNVADGLGMVYAVYRQDVENIAVYGSSLAVAGVGSTFALKEGYEIYKSNKRVAKIVEKGFDSQDAIIKTLKGSISVDEKSLEKVSKIISKLDNGCKDDLLICFKDAPESVRKRILSDPDFVEDWVKRRKQLIKLGQLDTTGTAEINPKGKTA